MSMWYMFNPILCRHVPALLALVLLHRWVDNNLFTYRMSCQLPRGLVLPVDCRIWILGICNFVVVILKLGVVMLDSVCDVGAAY